MIERVLSVMCLFVFMFVRAACNPEPDPDVSALMAMWQTWEEPTTLVWNSSVHPCDMTSPWTGVKCSMVYGNITSIAMNGMGLVHHLDPAVGSITSLTRLDLGNNEMTGAIPVTLSAISGLHELNLGTNRFSGTIPEQLSALTDLISLYLDRNELVGSVPPQLSALTAITSLYLNWNMLTGTLPQCLSGIDGLLVHNNPAMCGSTEGFEDLDTLGTSLQDPCIPSVTLALPWWVMVVIIILGVCVLALMIALYVSVFVSVSREQAQEQEPIILVPPTVPVSSHPISLSSRSSPEHEGDPHGN